MESRTEKQYDDKFNYEETLYSTRSSRNAKLYKQIYGKYDDLDNLPIEDNTDEIDMEKLRELVLNTNHEQEEKELKQHLNILEQKKRRIDEQRVYDINKILEKAKNENNKLKDTTTELPKINRDILFTLQSRELSLDEIKKASEAYQIKETEQEEEEENPKNDADKEKEEELSITREFKYKDLRKNLTKEQNYFESTISKDIKDGTGTAELSLDLFSDLKPTGNTIVTKPIKADEFEVKQVSGMHSSDTRDIDIIKKMDINKTNESDFFTNSYHFTKKDFGEEDDDFFDTPKKGGLFKIILLMLAITVFIGVIVYFVGTYGLGI